MNPSKKELEEYLNKAYEPYGRPNWKRFSKDFLPICAFVSLSYGARLLGERGAELDNDLFFFLGYASSFASWVFGAYYSFNIFKGLFTSKYFDKV